ncbi:CHAT domain-containing protein [Cyanobium gracile UHCC 0139]|uniref:CHAT domain-containing protein n=1 Tax=Cyanobium gracile UHCC 0139 TaxID=3110308 RepID=A0ABU5RRB8_9CYAN|nr:CHAT domain-containing protein [Cyanobium gracile]MEA5390329.1 CHAT domain-containing protein [Cyanobium gracile UHCC 0139]
MAFRGPRVRSALLRLVSLALLPFATLPVWADPSPPAAWPGQPAPAQGTDPEGLYLEGLKRFNSDQVPAAIAAWEQALLLFRQRGNEALEARTLEELGYAHYWLERHGPALEFNQQALALYRRLGAQDREAIVLSRIGDVFSSLNRPAEALESNLASLKLLGQLPASDPTTLLRLNLRIGLLQAGQGRDGDALEHFQEAHRLARRQGDRSLELTAGTAMGVILLRLGRYDAVITTMEPVLAAMEASKAPAADRSRVLQQIGFSHYWLNDYGRAIDAYRRGLELAREAGDTSSQLTLLRGLADTYFYVGNNATARAFSVETLHLARATGDLLSQAVALIGLGTFAYQDGDLAAMVRHLEQGLVLARSTGNRNLEANALSGLGHAHAERGDVSASRLAYSQSLEIYKAIGNRYNEGMMLLALAHGDLQANLTDQARRRYREALGLYDAIGDRYGQAQALTGLGLALHRAGDNRAAEMPLREAVVRNEEIRARLGPRDDLKVSLFDTQSSPYQALQVVLIAEGRSEDALVVAERARARAFVEQLQTRSSATRSGGTRSGPATLPGEAGAGIDPPMDLAAIREVARRQGATLVQYALINNRIYAWIVAPDGRISFRRTELPGTLPSLDRLVASSREAMGVRSARRGIGVIAAATGVTARRSAASEGALADLHRLLIQPIADLLPSDPAAPVILFPQGPLFFVPFPALRDARGEPLIERHTLLTAPSIAALATLGRLPASRPRGAASGEVLVVGNPTMPPISLSPGDPPMPLAPLPGAEQEARAIGAMFGTAPLIGGEATETAVVARMGRARLVHLATHGLLDDGSRREVPGAIVLAASARDDGLLRADEIMNLSLQADLFVLSACDTGRGTITGDGVIGLSRSLLTAGARSVLVSLWAVPDAPTTALMTAFYRELAAGRPKALALREAMRSVRRQHPDPVDWAAFTLIGATD